ncbi:MAG: hypothetical protein DRP74_02125 [Candidatus Omnitrophota bacterium]|nr:MAG: hypothetical protein DRP74_02125 [Candidatus Omnitrophota bacterium]
MEDKFTCGLGGFQMKKSKRLLGTSMTIVLLLILIRPFMARQIAVRGDGYFNYCMYSDAIRQYKKALWLDSHLSEAWNWLGYTYKQLDDRESAIETYEKAIEIDPYNRVAHYDLGMIYALAKDYGRAEDYFLKAASIPQEKVNKNIEVRNVDYYKAVLEALAVCQEKLGKRKEAALTRQELSAYKNQNK